MIIATVKSTLGKYLDHGKFNDEASALEWFQPFIARGVYGKSEQTIQTLVTPEVLDEQGQVVQAAVYDSEVIPAEFVIEFEPVVVTDAELRQAKIAAGAAARETCQKVLDLIAGHNLDRELTLEQITQMQQAFGLAEQALRAGRPTLAKNAITALQPDGVLITAAMKQEALDLLAEY